MSCNCLSTKVYCFHKCLLTQFWLFALNISVCTDTEHQGNRYPAARNSASPPETFTQQPNTPGTVTILQGEEAKLLQTMHGALGWNIPHFSWAPPVPLAAIVLEDLAISWSRLTKVLCSSLLRSCAPCNPCSDHDHGFVLHVILAQIMTMALCSM